MVNRCAIVKSGLVVNIALAEPEFALMQGWIVVTEEVAIGWTYDGEKFYPPIPPIPSKEEQSALRADAYRMESDPLFFKWQRGEATEQEWLDKIEEIKLRYPYPEVVA